MSVTCSALSNSRATCSAGFYVTDNSGSGQSDTCTACVDQTGCATHGSVCSSAEGHETEMECQTASSGYFVSGGGVATECSDMSDVPSVSSCESCTSALSSGCGSGTCASGFHTYSSSSQTCEHLQNILTIRFQGIQSNTSIQDLPQEIDF